MAELTGMLTMDELSQQVRDGVIDTVLVVFSDLYGRLLGKRFDADYFLADVAQNGTHACDYLLTVDMEMDPIPGYRYANWELGYGDVHLVPDLPTLRQAAWLERTAMVFADVKDDQSHIQVPYAPRTILRKAIADIDDQGFSVRAASELEYYIFRDSYQLAAQKGYHDLESVGWYIEDYHALQGAREESFNGTVRRYLKQSGVPVESSKGEWGHGQHELNIRYAEALSMADRHSVYKQCLKEVANQLGMSVTFMSKFDQNQAGSSCHIHISLLSELGNAFVGESEVGPIKASDTFRWFLGGWIRHLPAFMVFYAPTVNAYKRYQPGSWAPTRIAWSVDNRTAGFRVVGKGQSLRIECRIPGADCNPYLAYAAALYSGLDGIANQIEPPEVFDGDVYAADKLPHVPRSLRDASEIFAKDQFVAGVLGEEVVEHYAHFYRVEQAAYDNAVTDWERRRYFERI